MTSKHPTWDAIADIVTSYSATKAPITPPGISHIITEHIRQLATAVQNLWHGNIYDKSLDYLLRILLRLHLAPQRERRVKETIEKFKDSKLKKQRSTVAQRKHWKRKALLLCDDLADNLIRTDNLENKDARITAIIRNLTKLQGAEPKSVALNRPILSVEERLAILSRKNDSNTSMGTNEIDNMMKFLNLEDPTDLEEALEIIDIEKAEEEESRIESEDIEEEESRIEREDFEEEGKDQLLLYELRYIEIPKNIT